MKTVVQALRAEEARATATVARCLDLPFTVAISTLLGFGLVMVASASMSISAREVGDPLYYFARHAAYVSLGLMAGGIATRIPVSFWQRGSPYFLLFGIVLLALVLIPGLGRTVNGSTRWLHLGALTVQPSEAMKLFVILYLAGYLVRRGAEVRSSFAGFTKPIVVLIAISVLLLLEPDYGATVVLFATVLGMLFLGGVPMWTFLGWGGVVSLVLAAILVAAPYRVERLLSFMNPWADPFGSGFQLTQALIAIGRGEWFGVGLGAGVQKLFYLPEAHTDFLFAVLAEEFGLLGVVLVIVLFSFVTWRAVAIGRRSEDAGKPYGGFIAQGIGLLVALQAFVNIGVNMGVLPTKGLTLPLMSYGGTSLVMTCLAMGLVLRVELESRPRSVLDIGASRPAVGATQIVRACEDAI